MHALQHEGNQLRYSLNSVSWVISSPSLIFSFFFSEQWRLFLELQMDIFENIFSNDMEVV